MTMWIIYVALAAAWSGSVLAFPQNDFSPDVSSSEIDSEIFEADGFVFNGPASKPLSRITTSTTQEAVSPPITMTPATTTTTTTSTAAPDPQLDACIKSCPATLEYNPVCGTDNKAYDNPGILNCAARCGKDVTISYPGICQTNNMRG